MEFFNDIKGTLPYMDFSDSETISFDNPNGLPTSKNAIFKVKDGTNTGTIYCFDGALYKIEGEVIKKWKDGDNDGDKEWVEFYNSAGVRLATTAEKTRNALNIYKYVSENGEDADYGYVNFNGYYPYSVGDENNPIGYADHANITPISGKWNSPSKDGSDVYKSSRISANNMQLLKVNYGSQTFISLIDYVELETNEVKYTYLQTLRWTDGKDENDKDIIISIPFYAKQIGLSTGTTNKVVVVWGEFSTDDSFTEIIPWDDYQYKIIT